MTEAPSLVICDLGGVAIRIDPQRGVDRLSRLCDLRAAEVERRVFADPVHDAFERGEVSADRYLSWVGRTLELSCDAEEVVASFNDLLLGPDEGVLSVLQAARDGGARVVALSNTNELHRDEWWGRWGTELAVFEHLYLSFELGARKPESRAFELVLEQEGTNAADAVFIDDVPEYVEAAENLGIRGILYEDPSRLDRDLRLARG